MNIIPHRGLSIALLLLLGLLWGSGYTIARYCMTNGVAPLGYAFWQSLGPAVLMLIVVIAAKLPFEFSKQHIRYYIACGILGIAIPNTIIYFTAAHIPSGILTVLINTVPLIILPLAILLGQERANPLRIALVTLGFVGITLTIASNLDLPTLQSVPWTMIALLAPLCFALCAVIIGKYRPDNSHSLSLSLGMLIVSSLCLVPITLSMGEFHSLLPLNNLANALIVLEIILSGLGYIVLFVLIRIAGPVYYSLVGGIASIVGLTWGRIFFGETLNHIAMIGVSCIILAVCLLTLTVGKKTSL